MAVLKKKNQEKFEESSWILYFSLSAWIFISIFFLTGIFKFLLLSLDKKYQPSADENPASVHVLVDQSKNDEDKKKKNREYLSETTNEASGKLTPGKGFENLSESQDFKIKSQKSKVQKNDKYNNDRAQSRNDEDFKILDNKFVAKIINSLKQIKKSLSFTSPEEVRETTLPQSYEFKKNFVFSWDETGKPIIPSISQKYFKYYKQMLDKIQSNWAPPGGNPYPVWDNSMNNYIPGRNTYQTFPAQNIQVLFSLDQNGTVLEIQLHNSMGYESLDRSCIDAISRSKNFGPPPKEVLNENNQLIIPLVFRIIGYK